MSYTSVLQRFHEEMVKVYLKQQTEDPDFKLFRQHSLLETGMWQRYNSLVTCWPADS